MIKVIVSGVCGRMGEMIAKLVCEQTDMELVGAVERQGHVSIGVDAGEKAGYRKIGVPISERLDEIIGSGEVMIEFTNPETTIDHLEIAALNHKAIVIGTTGLNETQVARIKELSAAIPIVFAPNMSIGVNLLFKLVGEVARVLGDDYEVEIIEAHHHHKKDAPSGTALKLGKVIADNLNRDFEQVAVYGRQGQIGERKKDEIGIFAVRMGDVVGEHTVIFGSEGERIELTHRAHSRLTFVSGAIKAARFVVKAVPGLYDMQDVLKI
ncbi:MAG: 4-hydroxy-tetrahydrodipicolinate reductase [bacterium]|nr:4-hydroxy-tetrahydrodipicolinate reductase [bacterium]